MKKSAQLTALLSILCVSGYGQSQVPLASFDRIVASPHVNVILEKGEKESIRIVYNDIPESKVNVTVRRGKLKIYLDHARLVEKQRRLRHEGYATKEGIYKGQSITAYITYQRLKGIEIRGEEELRCDSEIEANHFKLKAYGQTEIRLASVKSRKMKTSLYGENNMVIKSGSTDRQVYRLFGENKVNTRGLKSSVTATRIFGESTISLNASEEVHINSLGESKINVDGTSVISKGIVLGKADIRVKR